MNREPKIIAVAGKGGVGKTSISAAFVRLLTEVYPDSPHHADWPQATLRAGEKFQKYIEYRFRKV